MTNSFEDFIRGCMVEGHTQVRLVPSEDKDSKQITFYAHGQGGAGSLSGTYYGSIHSELIVNENGEVATDAGEDEVVAGEGAPMGLSVLDQDEMVVVGNVPAHALGEG